MTVGADEMTDLKKDRTTGEFRERFLFASNRIRDKIKGGGPQDFPWADAVRPDGHMPMVVRKTHIVPKGRDKKWYQERAERNARALGLPASKWSFNWGIQAPKESGHPIPNVLSDKKARKEARHAARNGPLEYTKGGSQAAHARYKVKKAGFS